MFSKLVYLLPAFLSVVTGTPLPLSADTTDVPSTRELDPRAVDPTLDFSGSTWIWTGEQNGADNDDAPAGVRPFRKVIPSSSTKCPVCATIIISCDDTYSIVVNGKEIGASNGYHTSAVYTVGLEPEGHNVFAIAVNNFGGAAGLIAAISTIKATPPRGWTSPSFNDSAWIAASSEGPTAGTPWGMPPLPPAMNMAGVSWIRTNETSAAGLDPLGHRPFRKTIVSPYGKAAVCGKVVITADDEYTLYVNGNNIGNGSDSGSMQAYTVPMMDGDENLIAVDSVNAQPNTVAGLLAGILVAYSDGTSVTYYTDDSWKTLAETSPAGFEATDLDDSSWMSASKWMHGGSPTVPPA
ncbi:lectin [Armillaria fumosa]|nr:lectin [Armillaria fumosa]